MIPRQVDVEPDGWRAAVAAELAGGFGYFDFLTAVDEGPAGLRLVCQLARPDGSDRVVLTTPVPPPAAVVDSVVPVAPGAAWHERETAELFGIVFVGHPRLDRLLLGPDFVGHPLRKDFALAPRAAVPWPGAAEEVGSGERVRSGGRRRVPPPGTPVGWEVPDA